MEFKEFLQSLEISDELAEKIESGMTENNFHLTDQPDIAERFEKMRAQRDQAREVIKTELTFFVL